MSCFVEGEPDAQVLIVGMAPGREELATDRPFMGGSGRLLWSLLKREGVDRADAMILNTIGEWPEGSDGNPTKDQYARWWDEFDASARSFQGRVVLCLGGAAFWRFAGLSGIEQWRGYLVRPDEARKLERVLEVRTAYKTSGKGHKKGDERIVKTKQPVEPPIAPGVEWILPTVHPAAVMRSGLSNLPAFKADLSRVGRALRGELRLGGRSYSGVPSPSDLHGPVAFDIETGGIDGGIVRIGIAHSGGCCSLAWGRLARDFTRTELEA